MTRRHFLYFKIEESAKIIKNDEDNALSILERSKHIFPRFIKIHVCLLKSNKTRLLLYIGVVCFT